MFTIPAYFSGYRRRKDRSASISFSTQEITTDELTLIDELVMTETFGWLGFSMNTIQPSEMPRTDAVETNKTPAERMRSVLFVLWKQQGAAGDFNTFYKLKMEQLIDMLKTKLVWYTGWMSTVNFVRHIGADVTFTNPQGRQNTVTITEKNTAALADLQKQGYEFEQPPNICLGCESWVWHRATIEKLLVPY